MAAQFEEVVVALEADDTGWGVCLCERPELLEDIGRERELYGAGARR
ncbi:hypothetical protein [Bradyrhizobium sp. SEMIA]|nr:hypothetical protein [Bradyrhizobium sp. SEMIA]